MLRELSWRQLQELIAYDRESPIGAVRGDWQAASICTAFVNALLIANGSKKRFRTKDFLLEFGVEEKKVEQLKEGKSWQELKMLAQIAAATMGPGPKRR